MPRSSSQLMLSMLTIHPYTDTHTDTCTYSHQHQHHHHTHPATISSRHSAPAHVSEGVCVCVCVCVCSALGDSGHPHIHKAMLRRCCVCLSTLAIGAWDTAHCCTMLSHHTCIHKRAPKSHATTTLSQLPKRREALEHALRQRRQLINVEIPAEAHTGSDRRHTHVCMRI